MPYVNVPNDLSKIKTKIAFNLTRRQLICFGGAAAVGIPVYLLTRHALGGTGAMFLMIALMLPAFFMAMYERDGLPFEKVARNIIRAKFLRPGVRPYQIVEGSRQFPSACFSILPQSRQKRNVFSSLKYQTNIAGHIQRYVLPTLQFPL